MRVLYLPDYNEPYNTQLIHKLNQVYEVLAPELTLEQQASPAYLGSLIKNMLGEDFIILGEGLGAYWANLLGGNYSIYSLLINPCINPKAELGLELTAFDSWAIREGIVLIGQEFIELHQDPLENYFNSSYYAVKNYQTTDRLEQLIVESLEELSFYHRIRGHRYTALSPVEHGYLNEGKAIVNIIKLLTKLDPAKKLTLQNRHQGIYDQIAIDIAYDVVICELSFEESITRHFTYTFGSSPSLEEVTKLATQLKAVMPSTIQLADIPFRQEKRDVLVNFNDEEIAALKEINAKLYEFEKTIIPEALELDASYRKRLNDPQDALTNYDLVIATQVYLQENDPDYNDDIDNYMDVFTQIVTACSTDEKELLARLETDYNDLSPEHPLSCFKHCWLFHHLYAEAKLKFKDLLRIGFVWVDLDVQLTIKPDW